MFPLNNGNYMPYIGLGTYLVKGDAIRGVIDTALECGYRSFDTAAVYHNEEQIGAALLQLLPKYNLKRSDIYVTTKLSPADQGRSKARKAALKSLVKLKTSYIDLYLIHWPGVEKVDASSPMNSKLRKESWMDLVELNREGILKNIGVSNYTVAHLNELLADCHGVKPVVNQVEYHPMQQQQDLLKFCKSQDILVQAYCSLGGAGKSQMLLEEPNVLRISKKLNKTPAQILLKWALQHGVAIIPKSEHPDRIKSNIELNFILSEDEMNAVDSITKIQKFSWDPSRIK